MCVRREKTCCESAHHAELKRHIYDEDNIDDAVDDEPGVDRGGCGEEPDLKRCN